MARLYPYIRYSTTEQSKGHSEARQTALMERFAQSNGLELRSDFYISDFGKSSFSKKSEQTELNIFLEKLKNNEFNQKDVFAIENIDRLTRRGPIDALSKLNEIMSKMQVAIVNSDESKILKHIDIINLIQIAISAEQANQESVKKSMRLNASWENKREIARNEKKPITKRIPSWISINENNEFFLNEYASSIRCVFDFALREIGNIKIANLLNNENIKPLPRNKYWTPSTVHKVLANNAAWGMYQPKKQNTGKRDLIDDGEPIYDYFPKVIDEKSFKKIQALKIVNRTAGRRGQSFTNLFTGLLVCANCHSAMHVYNSGVNKRLKVPKSTNFLQCSQHKNLKNCIKKRVRLENFTNTILNALKDWNLTQIFDENNIAKKIIDNKKIIEGSIIKNQTIISNLEKITIELDGDVPITLVKSAIKAEKEIEELKIDLIKIENEINAISDIEFKFSKFDIDNLNYEERVRLNNFLRSIINKIELQLENGPIYLIEFKNGIKRVIREDRIIINIENKPNDLPYVPAPQNSVIFPADIVNDYKKLLAYFDELSEEQE